MRVLHVITALGVGGAEHMLLKLLSARALADVEQHVLALLPGGALAAPMRATGARVEEVNLLGAAKLFTGTARLALHARRTAPDLVQGWMYHGNLGATLARAASPRRVPLVWSVRQSLSSLDGENAYARAGIWLNRSLSGSPDCLLFNSRTSAEQHRRFGFRMASMNYLPNGFDTDRFAPSPQARAQLRAEWGVAGDEVVFGLLARYHPFKDHAGFLRAARTLLDGGARARFVLAGTGADATQRELVQAVARLGLGAHVSLLGERSDVPAVMSALDVCVSASSALEGFSNTLGEAMSCERPCIVTDVGDSAEVVAGTGTVVPPRDPAALAAAMSRMVEAGPVWREALGRRARQRIEVHYSLEAVAVRYAALYRELVGQRPG